MAIYAAGIAAAASIGGNFLGAASAKALQDDAQRWNRKMYQRRYQMTVKDMLAAGLNPILAAGVPPGGVPSSPMADGLNPNIGSNAVNSAISTYRAAQEVKNLKAQEDATRQGEAESRARTEQAYSQARNLNAQTSAQVDKNPSIVSTIEKEQRLLDAQIEANSARAYRDRTEPSRISFPGGSINPDALLQRLNSAAGILRR